MIGKGLGDFTVYHKPTCTTCRSLIKKFDEDEIDYEKVDYYSKPFTKNRLKQILKMLGMKPSDILRKREKRYKELDFANKDYSEDEVLNYLIKYPELIQRPIVVKGDKAIIARPIDKIEELYKE